MPTQLALRFDQVPVTCEVQERYHAIAACLAGLRTPAEAAAEQNLGYSTVTRWLRDFRNEGLPGLFPAMQYPREPYTPDRVIMMLVMMLVYFKCLVPKASERELARVIQATLGLRDPIASGELIPMKAKPETPKASQLHLYFGPELLTRAS